MAEISPLDAAKAGSHPLRVAILDVFNGEQRSPLSIAGELDEKLGNVSYHIAVLRKLGAVELTRTRQRRGAVEHFYKAKWRPRVEVEPVD